MKEKLNWCMNQKKGISIIDPSLNLSNGYLIKSSNSILMRLGIKLKVGFR